MKFLVGLVALVVLSAGGRYVYENATVTKCHDDKILWVKVGETCETVRRFQ